MEGALHSEGGSQSKGSNAVSQTLAYCIPVRLGKGHSARIRATARICTGAHGPGWRSKVHGVQALALYCPTIRVP